MRTHKLFGGKMIKLSQQLSGAMNIKTLLGNKQLRTQRELGGSVEPLVESYSFHFQEEDLGG